MAILGSSSGSDPQVVRVELTHANTNLLAPSWPNISTHRFTVDAMLNDPAGTVRTLAIGSATIVGNIDTIPMPPLPPSPKEPCPICTEWNQPETLNVCIQGVLGCDEINGARMLIYQGSETIDQIDRCTWSKTEGNVVVMAELSYYHDNHTARLLVRATSGVNNQVEWIKALSNAPYKCSDILQGDMSLSTLKGSCKGNATCVVGPDCTDECGCKSGANPEAITVTIDGIGGGASGICYAPTIYDVECRTEPGNNNSWKIFATCYDQETANSWMQQLVHDGQYVVDVTVRIRIHQIPGCEWLNGTYVLQKETSQGNCTYTHIYHNDSAINFCGYGNATAKLVATIVNNPNTPTHELRIELIVGMPGYSTQVAGVWTKKFSSMVTDCKTEMLGMMTTQNSFNDTCETGQSTCNVILAS